MLRATATVARYPLLWPDKPNICYDYHWGRVRAIQDYKIIWREHLLEVWIFRVHWWCVREEAIILSSGICMFINWSLASLEWTLVLYLYMILGPPTAWAWILPSDSGYFQLFLGASSGFHLPYKSPLWNHCLLIITNAHQPRFEINDYWWFIIGDLELLITDDYWSYCPASWAWPRLV